MEALEYLSLCIAVITITLIFQRFSREDRRKFNDVRHFLEHRKNIKNDAFVPYILHLKNHKSAQKLAKRVEKHLQETGLNRQFQVKLNDDVPEYKLQEVHITRI